MKWTIAQAVRKNSSVATITRLVRVQFPNMDDDMVAAVVAGIKGAL